MLINIHTNKLVLTNKKTIGINEFKDEHAENRSRKGIKNEYKRIVQNLLKASSTTANSGLKAKCSLEVVRVFERQISCMSFFRNDKNIKKREKGLS